MFIKAIMLTIISLFCLASPLVAHEGRPIYIEVEGAAAGLFEMRWKIPPVMADGDLPLITLLGTDCKIEGSAPKVGYLTGFARYHCAIDGMPSVKLHYPGVNPVLSTLVKYESFTGARYSLLHGPSVDEIALPERMSRVKVITDYTVTGAEHILSGYDHLAFVLCLMLLARSPRRIVFTVTGFTLGHSLTLGMMTFIGLSLSPVLVESLIAFSIVILAAELARGHGKTLAYKFPVLVACGFGLLHGLGFAGALSELGLPHDMKITALAFFNIGVELGQLAFVAVVYSFYWIANHQATGAMALHSSKLQYALLLVIGSMSSYWTIERIIA